MDPIKPDLQLPTGGQHLTVRLSYPGQEKVEDDDIRLGHNLDPLYRLNQTLKLRNPMNRRIAIPGPNQEMLQMELIVGNTAVEAWAEADGYFCTSDGHEHLKGPEKQFLFVQTRLPG
jgi:hypothetical protein